MTTEEYRLDHLESQVEVLQTRIRTLEKALERLSGRVAALAVKVGP